MLNKINAIIREEQTRAGAIEVLMPTIQPADLWRESGRYDAYGKEMLRIVDRHDREMLYGPTNEEMITEIVRAYVRSYKDLPLNLFHIQWKFRDEVRPRFGVMRSREFLMKDAYSFDLNAEAGRHSYNKMFVAYLRTFARMGLTAIPMAAESGPIGGNLSHEFIILAETGESEVFCHKDFLRFEPPPANIDFDDAAALEAIVGKWTGLYAATSEMHDERGLRRRAGGRRASPRAASRSAIFSTSEPNIPNRCARWSSGPDGKEIVLSMGSYGIGPSRLAAAIIEAGHDENGIIWPEQVAPFHVGIADLKAGDPATGKLCAELEQQFENAGLDVLLDDRDERPGAKFATLDLIGLPWQVVVGPKGLAEGKVEVKQRRGGAREQLSPQDAVSHIVAAVKAARG